MKNIGEVSAINSRAGWFITTNLSLAILALVQSLREDSVGWALYVWLSAVQGAAIGLLAGPILSDKLLDRTPSHRIHSTATGFVLSLLTYWGPIIATFVFGLILAKTLPESARPNSSLGGNGGSALFQSFTIFFVTVGCAWLIVWLDSFKLKQQLTFPHESSADA